jgi:hypothetical protein
MILWWTSTLNIDMEMAVVIPTPAPTEEKIVQRLPPPKVRFTVEQEMDMACAEVDCQKKCTESYGEKKEKLDVCKRTCAKERCKERCKNEPSPSYVERELKREKCLDKCSEKDEKCKRYCEEEAKRCKDRCKERAQRYFCVRDLDKLGQDDEDEVDPAKLAMDSDII